MSVRLGVLGPVVGWDTAGRELELRGPRHREVLARLIAAHGRVVPIGFLVDDLWDEPPAGAPSAVRTFVAALRRALEPDRPAHSAPTLLVTVGGGYALRTAPDVVDGHRFENVLTAAERLPPDRVVEDLTAALTWWRGPAYADFVDREWTRVERRRLTELRATAVESIARARLDLGAAGSAVPDLDAHVIEHPWREEGWRLLATALYRTDRQGDALAVLAQARRRLADELGLDPGDALRRLEQDILRRSPQLDGAPVPPVDEGWNRAAAAYQATVRAGTRTRLESTVGLLRTVAVTGAEGLAAARDQRWTTISAAEALDDPVLTARIVGGFDVPGAWTRSDDPAQAARIAAAAERSLAALRDGHPALRGRLLATIAVESRGTRSVRGPAAAREAEHLARGLDDPGLLAFALAARYLHSYGSCGLAADRDALGAELVVLSVRHDLPNFEILGRLVRMQARTALGDPDGAEIHAAAVDALAADHERPLASLFTEGFRLVRQTGENASDPLLEEGFRALEAQLATSGMPGVHEGLLALQLVGLQVGRGRDVQLDPNADLGPWEPWIRPHLLLADGRPDDAHDALRRAPDPEPGLLLETLWCLTAAAARTADEPVVLARARAALAPARDEWAAGSGLVWAGSVRRYLEP